MIPTLKKDLKTKVLMYTPLRLVGGIEVQFHSFLTSAVDRDEW
jgi:hypothetical protein